MSDIFTPINVETPIEIENAYETLVGEGKKFADNESLAKAKLNSDAFIARLTQELAELREAHKSALTLEEVKTQILSSIKPQESHVQPPVTPPATPANDSDIENLVSNLLEKKEVESRAKKNRDEVSNLLKSKFGEDAQIHLNQKANELGVSLEYLAKIANDSPSAFYRLIGVDATASPALPVPAPRSSQPQAQKPNQSGVRNHAYYERMKQNSPTEYFSQSTRMQQYKDIMALGDAYYS